MTFPAETLVVNLSNVFLVQLTNFFLTSSLLFQWLQFITGIIVHFRFHIRCISIHKHFYFNFFSASFCTTFLSAGIATSISVHVFFLFLIILSGLFAVTSLSVCLSVCLSVLLDSTTLWLLPLHTLASACVCTICLWFQCLRFCILSSADV